MMNDKLTIKQKLYISSGARIGLVLLLVFSIIYLNIKLSSLTEDSKVQNDYSNSLMEFSHSIKDYMTGKIDYEALKNKGSIIKTSDTSSFIQKKLNTIWEDLYVVEAKNNELKEISNKVMSLTDLSIEQSNTYIKEVSDKLADPYMRAKVSTLERLVLHGANVNTSANFTIKVLFLKLESDMTKKDELINFLDKAIANVSNDVERLKNTPFAQLPIMAIEANKKIKELSQTYINTKEQLNKTSSEIFHNTDDVIMSINGDVVKNSQSAFYTIKTLLLVVFFILISISILLTIFNYKVSHTMITFLAHLDREFSLLAKGDLTNKVDKSFFKRSDEIGKLSKTSKLTIDKIREIVVKIVEGAQKVNIASHKMSSIAFQVSNGATEQAASTEQVSSSMEQMSASIKQNAENSAATEKIALKAEKSMEIIRNSANNMAEAMTAIIDKISIINEIAGKTDLLAINAAVEAARAGEHGKGFAIVAGEVRQLAEHSRKAASEIDSVSQSSVALAHKSSELIAEVIPDIQNTASLVKEITAASQEQNSGIDQVNNAIQQLASVTQQHATSSEEVTRSASDLSQEARKLKDIVSFFKTEKQQLNYMSVDELTKQIDFLSRLKQQQLEEEEVDFDEEMQTKEYNTQANLSSTEIMKGLTLKMEDKDEEFENF